MEQVINFQIEQVVNEAQYYRQKLIDSIVEMDVERRAKDLAITRTMLIAHIATVRHAQRAHVGQNNTRSTPYERDSPEIQEILNIARDVHVVCNGIFRLRDLINEKFVGGVFAGRPINAVVQNRHAEAHLDHLPNPGEVEVPFEEVAIEQVPIEQVPVQEVPIEQAPVEVRTYDVHLSTSDVVNDHQNSTDSSDSE